MSFTVRQVADWIGGEVVGNGDQLIEHARPLAEARPGDLTFVEHDKHLHAWHQSHASAAIVYPSTPVNGRPLIRVKDPLMAFVSVVKKLRGAHSSSQNSTIHPSAIVHPTAIVGQDVTVGPMVVISEGVTIGDRAVLHSHVSIASGCVLGEDVTLHPHVVLYEDTNIGNRVIIHANSVIGADGFGYRTQGGKHIKVPQMGNVVIENDVEIGANSTIDRGTFGATLIGEGTKIDNLVMIGHNCKIGKHNLLVAQVGIAGSTTTGDYVVLAGQVGVADHLNIGARTVVGARSGLMRDVPADSRLLGYPPMPDREFMRVLVVMEKLPELAKDVRRLKQHLGLEE